MSYSSSHLCDYNEVNALFGDVPQTSVKNTVFLYSKSYN